MKNNKKQINKEELSICPKCEGKGYIVYEKCTNYHVGLYDHLNVLCECCNGKGIVNKKTTILIEFTPIKDNDVKIEKMTDKQIEKWEND